MNYEFFGYPLRPQEVLHIRIDQKWFHLKSRPKGES